MDIVAVRIETEVVQGEYIVRPTAAADTLDRDQFAFEIFGPLELGPRHKVPLRALEQRADDYDIEPSGGEIQHGVGAGQNRIDIAGYQRRCGEGSDAHVDGLDVEPVLAVKALLNPDPKHRRVFPRRAVGDAKRGEWLGVDRARERNREEKCEANKLERCFHFVIFRVFLPSPGRGKGKGEGRS